MARRTYHKAPDRAVPQLKGRPRLTMAQLAASTDVSDRQKSASVRLVNTREMQPPKGMGGYKVMRGDTLTAENAHQHSVRLFWADNPDDPGLKPDTKVIVDCTCPRHAFFYEVANAQAGASFIFRSNGAHPSQTNPGLRVGLCKHSYRLMAYLLRKSGRRRRVGEAQEAQRIANQTRSATPIARRPLPRR